MPRFVILTHDWPSEHWDLLLETGSTLRAWRLWGEPQPGKEVPAEPNADHRPLYLDYEGPVSGGRGSVERWDWGEFEWVEDENHSVTVELRGAKFSGPVVVTIGASIATFTAARPD